MNAMEKPAKKRARRESRIEAIQAAAEAVFLERGYEATSLDAVAQRANASKATIYAHFGSKLGLFEAIIQNVIAQVQVPLQAPGSVPAGEALARFGSGVSPLGPRRVLQRSHRGSDQRRGRCATSASTSDAPRSVASPTALHGVLVRWSPQR